MLEARSWMMARKRFDPLPSCASGHALRISRSTCLQSKNTRPLTTVAALGRLHKIEEETKVGLSKGTEAGRKVGQNEQLLLRHTGASFVHLCNEIL